MLKRYSSILINPTPKQAQGSFVNCRRIIYTIMLMRNLSSLLATLSHLAVTEAAASYINQPAQSLAGGYKMNVYGSEKNLVVSQLDSTLMGSDDSSDSSVEIMSSSMNQAASTIPTSSSELHKGPIKNSTHESYRTLINHLAEVLTSQNPLATELNNDTSISSTQTTANVISTTIASTEYATVNYNGLIGINATDPFAAFTAESHSMALPIGIQILMCLLYGTLALMAVTSNMIVCYIVFSNQRMRTATNYFIVNLAVGDILMALLCIPFTFPANLIFQYWPFGLSLCVIVSYSQANSVFISAYTMVAISIDKYLAIMYPMRLRMPKTQAKIIILVIWSAALMTSLPTALLSSLASPSTDLTTTTTATTIPTSPSSSAASFSSAPSISTTSLASNSSQTKIPIEISMTTDSPKLDNTSTVKQEQYPQRQLESQEQTKYFCQESWSFWPKGKYYYSMALMILQFVVPLFVLVITYTRIVIVVWVKRMPGEEDNARDARMARSKRKMIKMVIFCVIAFALTWLPFNALIVIGDMHPDIWENQNIIYIWFTTHYLAMCHTITNPLIYFWMNNKFRAGFKQVLGDICHPVIRLFTYVWCNCCCLGFFLNCSRRKYNRVALGSSSRKLVARSASSNANILNHTTGNTNMNSTNNNNATTSNINYTDSRHQVLRGNSSAPVFLSAEQAQLTSYSLARPLVAVAGGDERKFACNPSRSDKVKPESDELQTGCGPAEGCEGAGQAEVVNADQQVMSAAEIGGVLSQVCILRRGEGGERDARELEAERKRRKRRRRKDQSHAISIQMTATEFCGKQEAGEQANSETHFKRKRKRICKRSDTCNTACEVVSCSGCTCNKARVGRDFTVDVRRSSQSTATTSAHTNTTSLAISPPNSNQSSLIQGTTQPISSSKACESSSRLSRRANESEPIVATAAPEVRCSKMSGSVSTDRLRYTDETSASNKDDNGKYSPRANCSSIGEEYQGGTKMIANKLQQANWTSASGSLDDSLERLADDSHVVDFTFSSISAIGGMSQNGSSEPVSRLGDLGGNLDLTDDNLATDNDVCDVFGAIVKTPRRQQANGKSNGSLELTVSGTSQLDEELDTEDEGPLRGQETFEMVSLRLPGASGRDSNVSNNRLLVPTVNKDLCLKARQVVNRNLAADCRVLDSVVVSGVCESDQGTCFLGEKRARNSKLFSEARFTGTLAAKYSTRALGQHNKRQTASASGLPGSFNLSSRERSLRRTMLINNHLLSSLCRIPYEQNTQLVQKRESNQLEKQDASVQPGDQAKRAAEWQRSSVSSPGNSLNGDCDQSSSAPASMTTTEFEGGKFATESGSSCLAAGQTTGDTYPAARLTGNGGQGQAESMSTCGRAYRSLSSLTQATDPIGPPNGLPASSTQVMATACQVELTSAFPEEANGSIKMPDSISCKSSGCAKGFEGSPAVESPSWLHSLPDCTNPLALVRHSPTVYLINKSHHHQQLAAASGSNKEGSLL